MEQPILVFVTHLLRIVNTYVPVFEKTSLFRKIVCLTPKPKYFNISRNPVHPILYYIEYIISGIIESHYYLNILSVLLISLIAGPIPGLLPIA